MELKNLDKESQQLETPVSPQSRGSREIGDPEEKMPLHHHATNSLDKRNFMSSYLGKILSDGRIAKHFCGMSACLVFVCLYANVFVCLHALEADSSQVQSIQCHSLGRRKPKPIKIPVEPFFFKNDGKYDGFVVVMLDDVCVCSDLLKCCHTLHLSTNYLQSGVEGQRI